MPTKYEALVLEVAAVLAALVYILRLVRHMAKSVDFWTTLPTEYNQLVQAVKSNTAAIAALTERLDKAATPPARRGGRP